jgi:50S ribosomal protein L16 3-hydroxylase
MRAPSRAELLVDYAETFAAEWPEESRFGDAGLTPANGDGEIDDAAFARAWAAMPWLRVDAIGEAALRTWFASYITRYRSALAAVPRARKISDAELSRALASDAEIVRNPWSRAAWLRAGRDARLFVAGAELRCSVAFARRIGAGAAFPVAQAATSRDRDALRRLIDSGHVSLSRPARRSRR